MSNEMKTKNKRRRKNVKIDTLEAHKKRRMIPPSNAFKNITSKAQSCRYKYYEY